MASTWIKRNLKQTITHWVSTPDGVGGFSFAAPVTMLGRWSEKNELFRDMDGDEIVSQVTALLEEDVAITDYIALGDQTATADPVVAELAGAHAVRQFNKTPDLRQLTNSRKAFL